MLDRRGFLSALALGALSLRAPSALAPRGRSAPVLRIGVVAPGAGHDPDFADGARFGLEEVERAAAMLGGRVEAVRDPAALGGLAGLVGGYDDAQARALADAATRAGAVFVDVGATGAELRDGHRWPTTFHVARTAEQARAGAVLWHPSLERYGAAQLNERYRRRFERPMTGPAWASWLALKVLWEAALRADAGDGRALARRLADPAARFDGHKGRPLVFDPRTHQLVQPVYLVREGADGAAELEEVLP